MSTDDGTGRHPPFQGEAGGTAIDDIDVTELINHILDDKRSFLAKMMHFIKKEVRIAMLVKILDQIPYLMPCEP